METGGLPKSERLRNIQSDLSRTMAKDVCIEGIINKHKEQFVHYPRGGVQRLQLSTSSSNVAGVDGRAIDGLAGEAISESSGHADLRVDCGVHNVFHHDLGHIYKSLELVQHDRCAYVYGDCF